MSSDNTARDPAAARPGRLADVPAFYRRGEDLALALPVGTSRLVARRATGESVEGVIGRGGNGRLPGLSSGTWSVRACDDSVVLAEELTTVGVHQGERPVHGFVTSFGDEDVAELLQWHRALRSTVVQVYDWMESYTAPLGSRDGWEDPSHRPVSFDALAALAAGLGEGGAIAHAYAPVYAVGNDFAEAHPEMLMYESPGKPVRFLDQIVLANPANRAWQEHFAAAYGAAADAIGFGGFHVDTYGYPRVAEDAEGNPIDLRAAYESFLVELRAARKSDLISFNQVNGVPSAAVLGSEPRFRYCEIWPPNTTWRHFEGLLDRSSGRSGMLAPPEGRDELVRGSIACYPPVWGIDAPSGPVKGAAREASLHTVVCTEAVATMLGASALIYGDLTAALCDPYYPKHARLSSPEAATVLAWRRFALRCRDLFTDGEDTSWYEIGDENGSVAVDAGVPVRPEPIGGCVFARVVHGEDYVAVGVLDLTGSEHGSWSEPTGAGSVTVVTVRVLLAHPERWSSGAAVLGLGRDDFAPVEAREVPHRQGRALEVQLRLVGGWSLLRVVPRS